MEDRETFGRVDGGVGDPRRARTCAERRRAAGFIPAGVHGGDEPRRSLNHDESSPQPTKTPPRKAWVEGEEALELEERVHVDGFDVRAADEAGPGQDVGGAVAVDVGDADADAAAEERIVDDEVRLAARRLAGVDPHFRLAAGALADDHVGEAVAVDVAAGHEDAAGEIAAERRGSSGARPGSVPLKTSTCGPPPGPAPVMMSAKPSSLTSPAPTRTPPVNAAP